jgi:3-hydroxyisobutyrate dehydrogenase-like beta-hydroxyacid dehydrogenase
MSEHLGFIGTGNLGGAIANGLLKAGFTLTIYDTDPDVLAPLHAHGAHIADSARAVGDAASIVFACLPSVEISQAVALAPDGVAAGKATEIYVEVSTLGIEAIKTIAGALAHRNIQVLDTPVVGGGGGSGVAEGKIAMISAGPRAAFDRVAPILGKLSRNIFYVGEQHGLAQVCKVVNAALAITGLTITCEAMVMGVKAGIDPQVLLDVVNAGSGRNVTTEERFARTVLARKFGGNQLRIALKDMEIYAETAHALNVPAFVGAHIAEIWQAANSLGGEHLVQFFERFADVEVKRKD